jgi:hypothetical protein
MPPGTPDAVMTQTGTGKKKIWKTVEEEKTRRRNILIIKKSVCAIAVWIM